MAKQVWGTFAVEDHLEPRAFVAETLLYDRLVVPVPPHEERGQWEERGWQPGRLDRLLGILGDRAYPVEWDAGRREQWRSRRAAGTAVARDTRQLLLGYTRSVLVQDLPRHVTGIQAVTNYTSLGQMESELGLRPAAGGRAALPGGAAAAVLGHEFLVPDDPRWTHEELLGQAVQLSSQEAFQRKRASFWRWQREFLDGGGLTDQEAVQDAVREMHGLMEEEKAEVRRRGVRTAAQFAFLIGSVTLGFVGAPLLPVAVGGAFISLGQFAVDHLPAGADEPKPVSLLRDARKHFGWG